MSTSTYLPKIEGLDRKWFVIDAKDVVLGKLATTAASILAGKRKPIYTPFLDTGDHVVVINAEKVHLTGRKEADKFYHRHSGYPGGIKSDRGRRRPEEEPGPDHRRRDQGHAAQDQAGAGHVHEAQGVRRGEASPPGPEAAAARRQVRESA